MKKNYILLILTVALILNNTLAGVSNYPNVMKQLEDLNKQWLNKESDFPELKTEKSIANEVDLIRRHLSLVESTLRDKNNGQLSVIQKVNRKHCLDILHNYLRKGVFPKNLYHTKRTPYFIDKFGTACAVGQLIISTGYSAIADKISKENNYAYIKELDLKYSEIGKWANQFGFTVEELAWIQPTYCDCSMSGPGVRNNSCNPLDKNPLNKSFIYYDGYFQPEVTGYPEPYTYEWLYIDYQGQWRHTPCGGCNLWAGEFKCIVTDGDGLRHEYFQKLTQPDAISPSITYTNENGSCNGSVIIVPKGGVPGYTYTWVSGEYANDTFHNGTFHNLCKNSYWLSVTDGAGCIAYKEVKIGLTLNNAFSVMPNPGQGFYNIVVTNPSDSASIELYNSLGVLVYKHTGLKEKNSIDLSNQVNGLYILKFIKDNTVIGFQKIVKE